MSFNFERLTNNLHHYLPVVFSMLIIALWVAFSAWINSSQFGDNIEQFNWAHGPEWGYWKHPPLPTLLIAGAIAAFGNWVYWAYCLSALCFMGTAFVTWKIASKLLGDHAAAATVILLGLHLGFSSRAQIYNHNTVLLLVIAATVWASFLAVESKSLWRWAVVGGLAGLALLTKYQAVAPLLGILFALQRSGALKEKENLLGLGLALLTACLVFLPNFVWLWTNDFPLQYAKHSAQNLGAVARVKTLFSFFFNQIKFHLPIFIALGLVIGCFRFKNLAAKFDDIDISSSRISAWMWGLVGFPAIFLALMALLGGVRLESHWGLQTFQFACLLLVWRFKSSIDRISVGYFLMAAFLVHAIAIGLYYQSTVTAWTQPSLKRIDRVYPAQALANQAALDWRKATHCPLKYVVGPAFEAGLIALYSGSFPAVQEEGDPAKSPWINPSDVTARGAIQVWIQAGDIPIGVNADGSMDVPGQGVDGDRAQKVYWHIALPQQPCAASIQ